MLSSNLKKAVNKTSHLPALPRTVVRMTELINDPDSSANDLANVIYSDPTLTGQILGLVNSSDSGFSRKTYTVPGVIALLGFNAVKNLLIDIPLINFLLNSELDKSRIERFLDHSLCCAVGAQVIGDYINYETEINLFVLGLLHDIGKIVEILFFPNDYSKAVSLVKKKGILMVNAEKHIMEITHPEIGALLAEKWEMPPAVINTITYHHKPHLAGEFALETSIVHLADIFCRTIKIGPEEIDMTPPQNIAAWKLLEIRPGSIKYIIKKMIEEFKEISSSLHSIHNTR